MKRVTKNPNKLLTFLYSNKDPEKEVGITHEEVINKAKDYFKNYKVEHKEYPIPDAKMIKIVAVNLKPINKEEVQEAEKMGTRGILNKELVFEFNDAGHALVFYCEDTKDRAKNELWEQFFDGFARYLGLKVHDVQLGNNEFTYIDTKEKGLLR